MEVEEVKGKKFDDGKLDYDLLPPTALKGIVGVFTYGAKKYAPGNWKLVTPHNRYLSAAMRHIEADREGISKDEESGLLHLDHAITSLIMLRELKYNK